MNYVKLGRLSFITVVAAVALLVAACAQTGTAELQCEDGGEHWTEYRLFMGRSIGDNEVVSDVDWESFLAETITARFPDGLSVIDVSGQGRSDDGTIEQERTKMLLVLAPPGNAALDRMNEISAEYKRRFGQNSVLRVVTEACVAFK
jgi:hypothetical protein